MTSPLSKLLIVGALCWVAPLSAEPSNSEDQAWSGDEPSCPEEIAKRAQIQEIVVTSDAASLQHHGPSAAMLP